MIDRVWVVMLEGSAGVNSAWTTRRLADKRAHQLNEEWGSNIGRKADLWYVQSVNVEGATGQSSS